MRAPVCFSFAIDLLTFMVATRGACQGNLRGLSRRSYAPNSRCIHGRGNIPSRLSRGFIAMIHLQTKPLENTRLGVHTTAKSGGGKTWPRKFRLTGGRRKGMSVASNRPRQATKYLKTPALSFLLGGKNQCHHFPDVNSCAEAPWEPRVLGLLLNGKPVPLQAAPLPLPAAPNDRVNVAFIGFGIRGNILMEAAKKTGQANWWLSAIVTRGI